MSQSLHIFRKDLRYLRGEIALFIAASALFAVGASGPLGTAVYILVVVGAIHLTSRAIHAEAIPGTSQFWITRPYRWQSLLLAKLLFIAVCIDLPIGAGRFAALAIQGFPLVASLPALLWSQLLLFAAMLLVAALAALTAGIMEFSVGMLLLAIVYLIAFFILPFAMRQTFWPVSIEWLHELVALVVITAVAAAILLWQYRDRRTLFSRAFGTVAGIVAATLYVAIPAAAGFSLLSRFSHEDLPQLQVAPNPDKRMALDFSRLQFSRSDATQSAPVRVPLPLLVTGLPGGVELGPDSIHISLDWPSRETWTGNAGISGFKKDAGRVSIDSTLSIPIDLYKQIRQPARIRGSVYLTLFGSTESRTIPFTSRPANALDGLQCFSGLNSKVPNRNTFNHYVCRAFFGWPSRLVFARTGDNESDFTRLVSYSPFPSGLDLDSMESRYTSLVLNDSTSAKELHELTIVTKKPIAHLRREFDVSGVRMSDFILGGSLPLR